MKRLFALTLCLAVVFGCIAFTSCKKEQKDRGRYEINAEYREDARSVSGTVKVTFTNPQDQKIEELKFNLYPNAYRKKAIYPAVGEGERDAAYYDGESYGEITVTSVNGAKSWSVVGADENILKVALIKPLSEGEAVTLDLSFVTELAKIEHRLGVSKRTVNLVNFYPRLCAFRDGEFLEDECSTFGNPFRADCADYSVQLTVPNEYAVLGGGTKQVVKGLESKTKYAFELQNARDFTCALAKKAKVLETQATLSGGNSVKIEYAAHDTNDQSKLLNTAKRAVEYFSESFGEYPYSTLTIVRVGSCVESSSHTSTVFLSDNLSETENTQALVRSIARQWWGVSVGSDELCEAWQSESLSQYSAILFFERYQDYGLTRSDLVGKSCSEYRSYFSVYGSVFGGVDTRMSRSLKGYANAYEYERISRDKGVVMFDSIRNSIGDKPFFSALKYYYKNNAGEMVKPIAMYEAFEKSGVCADGFLDSFLTGKAVI